MYQSCTLASNCNVVPIAPGPDNCDQLQYTLCWSTTASCNIPRGNRWRGEHGTLEGHILVALINQVYSLSLKDKKKKFPWFVTQKLRFPSVPPEKILLPSHTTIITPVSLTCRQKNKLSIFSQNSHHTLIFFFFFRTVLSLLSPAHRTPPSAAPTPLTHTLSPYTSRLSPPHYLSSSLPVPVSLILSLPRSSGQSNRRGGWQEDNATTTPLSATRWQQHSGWRGIRCRC